GVGRDIVYRRAATAGGPLDVVPRRGLPGLAIATRRSHGAGGPGAGTPHPGWSRTTHGRGADRPGRPRPVPAGERAPPARRRAPSAALLRRRGLGNPRRRARAARVSRAVVSELEGVPVPAGAGAGAAGVGRARLARRGASAARRGAAGPREAVLAAGPRPRGA